MEKKDVEKQLIKPFNIKISIREIALLILILSVIAYSSFLTGFIVKGIQAQADMINVLGWWKMNKDCSKCDQIKYDTANCALSKYNMSVMKNDD